MSLEICYHSGDAKFTMRLPDDDLFALLVRRYASDAEIVFGLDEGENEIGQPTPVSRQELIEAVERLLTAFRMDPGLKPLQYLFDFEIFAGFPAKGHKNVSQVRLPGRAEYYELFGGVGQCALRTYGHDPGVYGDPIDMRDQAVIETESHGPIKVRKTTKQSLLVAHLKKLLAFLKFQTEVSVVKEAC